MHTYFGFIVDSSRKTWIDPDELVATRISGSSLDDDPNDKERIFEG